MYNVFRCFRFQNRRMKQKKKVTGSYLCRLFEGWKLRSSIAYAVDLEPILRLLNLQPQRQRCGRLERSLKVEAIIFVFETNYAIRVNFNSAGVVNAPKLYIHWIQYHGQIFDLCQWRDFDNIFVKFSLWLAPELWVSMDANLKNYNPIT
jgi:hypothetical protein